MPIHDEAAAAFRLKGLRLAGRAPDELEPRLPPVCPLGKVLVPSQGDWHECFLRLSA